MELLEGRNLPAGDNDLRLNLDDLNPPPVVCSTEGDDGRIDFRRAAGGGDAAMGGEMGRMVGLGLMVGVGPDLIEDRIEYRPLSPCEARGRCRWKLLAEASESLSYVGAGALDLGTTIDPVAI